MGRRDEYDVAIVGGGAVGLAIATRLRRGAARALTVAVVDADTLPLAPDGDDFALRVSALSPRSARVLGEIWDEIAAARVQPFVAMRVWDSASRADAADSVTFRARDHGLDALGWIVENDRLRACLAAAARNLGIELIERRRLDGVDFARRAAVLSFDDGSSLRARLVVGADGAGSRVRDLAGIRTSYRDYAQRGFVTHVASAKPHESTAWQQFNPDGPMALLPLPDGRSSVVYSTAAATARELERLSPALLGERLTTAAGGVLGALTVTSAVASFPLTAAHAETYATERCVLAGDAAHRVHPLAGQGVNLGLADAGVLADTIGSAAAEGRDPGDLAVLRRFERRRRNDNELTLATLEALHRMFTAGDSAVARFRRGGMALFERGGELKRAAARHAMGL
ncbi:MAG: FAD-dependent monooxygenase [Pseudomonadota bacterium]